MQMSRGKVSSFLGRVLAAVLLAAFIVGGWTAIYVVAGNPMPNAAKRGNLMVVRVLLAFDFSVDKTDDSGDSALYLAAANDHSWTAKRLIREGANAGRALGEAARKDDREAVKMLLKLGAAPNGDPSGGNVPLLAAAANLNADMISLLLEAGADVNAEAAGENALHKIVAARGSKQPANRRRTVKKEDPGSFQEAVRVLLDNKININAVNISGQTPLYLAAENGDAEIVQMLIAAGADLGVKANSGETAFKAAQRTGQSNICDTLNREAQKRRAPSEEE